MTTIADWNLPDGSGFTTLGDMTSKRSTDRATVAVTASLGQAAYDAFIELRARLAARSGHVSNSAAVRFAVRLANAALKSSPDVAVAFRDPPTIADPRLPKPLSPEAATLLAAVQTGRFRSRREIARHLGMTPARVSALRQRLIDRGRITSEEWMRLARPTEALTTPQTIANTRRLLARSIPKAGQKTETRITLVSAT